MSYDLFISYARRDHEHDRIPQLVVHLRQEFKRQVGRDLNVFFDQTEIQGMADWRNRLWRGLRDSRLLLTCLSPAYFQSPNCEWEVVEYLKYEIGHRHGLNGIAPVYLRTAPCMDGSAVDSRDWVAELLRRQYFDLRPWSELGPKALSQPAVKAQLDHLCHQIISAIRRGEQADTSQTNVDAPNPHFIGRTATLRQIRDNFAQPGHIGVLTAVNGLGGLGKTALAIEYAHTAAPDYGGGRWQLRCAGQDDLRLVLSELATPLGFEFTDDEKQSLDLQFDRTRRELKQRADAQEPHRCLLLLDNVDQPNLLDPAQIARLNPGDWLHLLATTRLGEHDLHGTHRDRSFLPVDELPPDDALALIETYQPGRAFRSDTERAAAQEIVRLLGRFTLAVESAAVYLGQFANDVTCAAFLTRLKKEGLEGLDTAATQSSEGILHGEKCFRATLQPTLARLNEQELLTLGYAALLPAEQVAIPWLRALVAKKFPAMAQDSEPGYPDQWKTLLRRLFSLRLFQNTSVMDTDGQPLVVRVHRLVQELVLLGCSEAERAERQQGTEELISQRNIFLHAVANWIAARWELGPFTSLARLWDELNHHRTVWLLNETSRHWYNLAEWSQAERLANRARMINEQRLGSKHPDFAVDLNNLAQILQSTNRLDDAEPLMRRALEIDEDGFGPVHPNIAVRLNNLAVLLQSTNRLREAEPLMRRALDIDEQCFGPDHSNVATRLSNLAALLQATDRAGEAEPLARRALVINQRCFGANHPKVTITYNNLAQLLKATNRLGEAEELMRLTLAIEEENFGSEHPNVATALSNLAALLQATNRLEEAESFLCRALTIDEKCLGPDHTKVAVRLNNLAQLLMSTNRLDQAEKMIRRAISILEKSLGANHPDVATALNNLAQLLQSTNRQVEAEYLMRRALAIYERSFGSENSRTAIVLNNLAHFLINAKKLNEAKELLQKVVEILLKFTVSTGHPHPNLRAAVESYTNLLSNLGSSEKDIKTQLESLGKPYGFQYPQKI